MKSSKKKSFINWLQIDIKTATALKCCIDGGYEHKKSPGKPGL